MSVKKFCPSAEEIVVYASRKFGVTEKLPFPDLQNWRVQQIEHHIESCSNCQKEIEFITSDLKADEEADEEVFVDDYEKSRKMARLGADLAAMEDDDYWIHMGD